jgi:drug/metabolite transporter (DMT)-like permease
VGCSAMYLYFLSLRYGELGKMYLIFNLGVLWAALLSALILKEKITLPKMLAMTFALLGVFLILKPQNLNVFGKAEILALFASVFNGLVIISLRKLRKDHNSYTIIFIFFAFTSLLFSLPAIHNFKIPNLYFGLLIILLGILGFLAHIFMTGAYKHVSAATGATMALVSIPLMYVLGVLFFAEKIDLASALGIILFILGLYIITDTNENS